MSNTQGDFDRDGAGSRMADSALGASSIPDLPRRRLDGFRFFFSLTCAAAIAVTAALWRWRSALWLRIRLISAPFPDRPATLTPPRYTAARHGYWPSGRRYSAILEAARRAANGPTAAALSAPSDDDIGFPASRHGAGGVGTVSQLARVQVGTILLDSPAL